MASSTTNFEINPFYVHKVDKLCGVCLNILDDSSRSAISSTISSIEHLTAQKILESISQFKLEPGGPQSLCQMCLGRVLSIYEFQQMCNKARCYFEDFKNSKKLRPAIVCQQEDYRSHENQAKAIDDLIKIDVEETKLHLPVADKDHVDLPEVKEEEFSDEDVENIDTNDGQQKFQSSFDFGQRELWIADALNAQKQKIECASRNDQAECNSTTLSALERSSPMKRAKITLELKKGIIEMRERGVSITDLARMYNKSSSTICTILKNKERIKEVDPSIGITRISTQRSPLLVHVERLLLAWIRETQAFGGVITDQIICAKAKGIFDELAKVAPSSSAAAEAFKGSRGWLMRFKRRTGICGVGV